MFLVFLHMPCESYLGRFSILERVSTRVTVAVVRELFSLLTSTICVRVRGQRSEVMRIIYHMVHLFVYCCILTTVDS